MAVVAVVAMIVFSLCCHCLSLSLSLSLSPFGCLSLHHTLALCRLFLNCSPKRLFFLLLWLCSCFLQSIPSESCFVIRLVVAVVVAAAFIYARYACPYFLSCFRIDFMFLSNMYRCSSSSSMLPPCPCCCSDKSFSKRRLTLTAFFRATSAALRLICNSCSILEKCSSFRDKPPEDRRDVVDVTANGSCPSFSSEW